MRLFVINTCLCIVGSPSSRCCLSIKPPFFMNLDHSMFFFTTKLLHNKLRFSFRLSTSMENTHTNNLFFNSPKEIPATNKMMINSQTNRSSSGFMGFKNQLYLSRGEREDVPYNYNGKSTAELAAAQSDEMKASISRGKKKGEKKVRKPRFAFETRSHVDILDDGYRWRKYGQKAVKNNRFPRSYYRCTHQECGVKKQVQRLSKDESIVVTTYEGRHTHPVEKHSDNFEQILSQMHIYPPF